MRKLTLLTAASAMALGLGLAQSAQAVDVTNNQANVGILGTANNNANDRSVTDNDGLDLDVKADSNNIGFGNASGESTADNDFVDNKEGTIDNDEVDVDVTGVDITLSNKERSGNTAVWAMMWGSGNSASYDGSIHNNIAQLSHTQLSAAVTEIQMFDIEAGGYAFGGLGAAVADGEAKARAKGKVRAKADGDSTAKNRNKADADAFGATAAAAGHNEGGTVENEAGNSAANGGLAINLTDGDAIALLGAAANWTKSEDGGNDAKGMSDKGGSAEGAGGDVGDTAAVALVDADANSGDATATATSGDVANTAVGVNESTATASNDTEATLGGSSQETKVAFNFTTGGLLGSVGSLRGINPVMQNTGFAHNQNVGVSVNALVGSVNGSGSIRP